MFQPVIIKSSPFRNQNFPPIIMIINFSLSKKAFEKYTGLEKNSRLSGSPGLSCWVSTFYPVIKNKVPQSDHALENIGHEN